MNTVDAAEIKHFSKDSDRWWDEDGPFRPLHRLNPVRLSYIKQQICDHYDRDMDNLKALKGLSVLDVGCGGGLVCEAMARLGAKVTGIDADENAIEAAKAHATEMELDIDYQDTTTSALQKQHDIVLALEIVEHVSDVPQFVQECAALCKPGGLMIFSTLNRTAKSYALGIIAAEHVLRWVPRGTHSWKKFLKPSELSRTLRQEGAQTTDVTGLIFDPLKNEFRLSETDLEVNYLLTSRFS